MTRALMWFRSDLRVRDNTALAAACRAASDVPQGGVVALFVVSPGEWAEHDFAPVKVDLMLRTLRELSPSLAKLNIPLVLADAKTRHDVPGVVLAVAKQHRCDALHFNLEHELNERRRDERTIEVFEAAGLKAGGHHDQCLATPGDVRTGEGRFFTVFTPFKKASYKRMYERGVPEVVPMPKPQAKTNIASSPIPGVVPGFESNVDPALWPAGEAWAHKRLTKFCADAIVPYKARRDFPGVVGTSKLSPYLTVGAISHRQCIAAAIEANPKSRAPLDVGPEGITHWISEVLWREFYIHIMVGFPRGCMGRAFQPATEVIRWNDDERVFEAWCEGRTGVPIVDAGMRQLARTGWMHNRVRMITAMFLTKNLFVDWRKGERWFMRHLVDGFLASNNGGWQWSASTGTDAAPYFRIFNPISQSQKFDEQGEYIREFVPELADVQGEAIHEPWTLPLLLKPKLDYPTEPIVDISKSRERAIEAFRDLKKA
ncbi:MAG: deoxyribodipyrimidine photo-lyase [Phycisphaerales bacterium]